MDRREFLRAAGGGGVATALAGCLGFRLQSGGVQEPPVVSDRPDGVYVPGHVEGMQTIDTGTSGDYAAGLSYSYAHRFWTVSGSQVSRTSIESDDDVHLMASVWDPETRQVLPETGLSLEITKDGSLVSQEVIYPMLSQPMGFHYGANFGLDGEGEYTVTLAVGAVGVRKTGAFRGRFTEPTTIRIPFTYDESRKSEIPFRTLDERAGTRGAVERMEMAAMPDSTAPPADRLPGTVVGRARSDDAVLLTTVLDTPPAGVDADGPYLAVSARTRYTRSILPAMGLQATLTRDGTTVFDGDLTRTLDPELSYHYGAVVDSVESGDELTITPTVQPQTARHEGYETAFGGTTGPMEPATLTVSR
ncbi:MAG: iron transporter [Halobaculum sp.]